MSILDSKAAVTAVAILTGAAVLYWLMKKAGGEVLEGVSVAAQRIGTAVNPVSDQNLAYRGVNAVGASISGSKEWSLGSAIYDLVHPSYDPNAPASTHKLNAASDADGKPSVLR